jgi:hypothetical protein
VKFEQAGSDADLRAAYLASMIDDRIAAGERALSESNAALAAAASDDDVAAAEQTAREGLGSFASALNWAEDGPREAETHARLDEAGRWVRSTFGCILEQEGTTYFVSCPVRLGHVRVGLSIGGTARRICSLCGEDLSECEHQRGAAYLVPGGVADFGWCRVCRQEDCGEHTSAQTYRVGVVAIIREMDLVEASIVSKPAQPDARFHRQSIATTDLQAALGEQWEPGMEVGCDFCLQSCRGLARPQLGQVS